MTIDTRDEVTGMIEMLTEQTVYARRLIERVAATIKGGDHHEVDAILHTILCLLSKGVQEIEALKVRVKTDMIGTLRKVPVTFLPLQIADKAFQEIEALYEERK